MGEKKIGVWEDIQAQTLDRLTNNLKDHKKLINALSLAEALLDSAGGEEVRLSPQVAEILKTVVCKAREVLLQTGNSSMSADEPEPACTCEGVLLHLRSCPKSKKEKNGEPSKDAK